MDRFTDHISGWRLDEKKDGRRFDGRMDEAGNILENNTVQGHVITWTFSTDANYTPRIYLINHVTSLIRSLSGVSC